MPQTLQFILVGQHFNKPSGLLLRCVPNATAVQLEAEPENPYDPLAVAVYLPTAAIDRPSLEALNDDLESQGLTLREVWAQARWKLGHVAASGRKPLNDARSRTGLDLRGNAELLGLRPEGEPLPEARLELRSDGLTLLIVSTSA